MALKERGIKYEVKYRQGRSLLLKTQKDCRWNSE